MGLKIDEKVSTSPRAIPTLNTSAICYVTTQLELKCKAAQTRMVQIPREIGDFSILPISMPLLPAFPQATTHYLYVRKNSPKIPTPDDSRSLFLANVPVDGTEAHVRALFTSLVGVGKFESVTFENDQTSLPSASALEPAQAVRLLAHSKKRKRGDVEVELAAEREAATMPRTWARPLKRSGGTAVVLLADPKSVDLVLKAISKVHRTSTHPVWGEGVDDSILTLGSQWLRAHNQLSYPDKEALQGSVDAFFTIFNRKEQEAAELAKRLRNEPDEDGFVTVARGGRNAPARRDEAEEARRRMLEKEEKKKTELGNFYRFQMREQRKAEQVELIKRFETDRKKVSAMKERRGRFHPQA